MSGTVDSLAVSVSHSVMYLIVADGLCPHVCDRLMNDCIPVCTVQDMLIIHCLAAALCSPLQFRVHKMIGTASNSIPMAYIPSGGGNKDTGNVKHSNNSIMVLEMFVNVCQV